jgi:hypothetical protein
MVRHVILLLTDYVHLSVLNNLNSLVKGTPPRDLLTVGEGGFSVLTIIA